ncbi:MAG: cytochrome c oxidase assembly protein, partial [Mesorhizobium sp.]
MPSFIRKALSLGGPVSALSVVLAPTAQFAHGWDQEADGWSLSAVTIIPLGIALLLYAAGVARLWRRAGMGRGVTWWRLACFATGWALLVVALMSPLHELGERLFTAHMVEHEVLMVVAAPSLVLSRPLGVMLWAFPPAVRRSLASARWWPLRSAWRGLPEPASATILHGLALWLWHMPILFDAALT